MNCEFSLIFKQWLSEENFFAAFTDVEKAIEQVLEDKIKQHKFDDDKTLKDIKKRVNMNYQGKYSDVIMGDYGEIIILDSKAEILWHKKKINGLYHYFRITSYEDIDDNGNKVIKSWVILKDIEGFNNNNNSENLNVESIKWLDVKLVSDFGKNDFIRYRNNYVFKYKDGKLISSEIHYNFPNFVEPHKDQIFDNKIGTFDLETFPINNNNDCNNNNDHLGLGVHVVYAGGWATNNAEHFIRKSDYDTGEYGPSLVNKDKSIIYNLIESIFANKLYSYTFYCHNLGLFDSFYVLDSLTQKDTGRFKITGKWKSEDVNKMIGFTIVDTTTKKRIYMKDSMNFYAAPLHKVLKDYKCEIQKGVFPHGFIKENTFNYIGSHKKTGL